MKEKVLLAWSSGKDSALALHGLRNSGRYEVAALLTTITEDYDRISMHGVRRALVEKQSECLGLPLVQVLISKDADDEEYGARMRDVLADCREKGILHVAFGDVLLEDVRKYREEKLGSVGMKALFPIWKRDTTDLAHMCIDLGFEAVITCVDTKVLGASFAGRIFDRRFLADLPADVDPCGENGEFHSFVYAGPIFREPVPHKLGEVVLRESRWCFCDVIGG